MEEQELRGPPEEESLPYEERGTAEAVEGLSGKDAENPENPPVSPQGGEPAPRDRGAEEESSANSPPQSEGPEASPARGGGSSHKGRDGGVNPPPKKSAWKALFWLVFKLAVVAGLVYLALLYVFGVFRLSGNNMYPMLKDGDLLVTYRLEEYHSQDVVAYWAEDEIHFGRIVARNGDTLSGDEMGLFLNGGRPSEEIFYPTQILDTALELPLELGEGQYVILNDFREDQGDSRYYGVIEEDAFEGKVIFIFRRRGF